VSEDAKETARIEAFSDGVFAIAITLLVLDMKVPSAKDLPADVRLISALGKQWPTYLAYVTSFLTILIMWVNHHRLFQHIKRTDHLFLMLNGMLLMGVTIVPFPTGLVAEYIEHREARTAAAVYSGCFVVIAIFFNVLWRYASSRGRLLGKNYNAHAVSGITRQYSFGPVMYGVAFVAAFVSVTASVGICLALACFFAVPSSGRARRMI
jgi:uncharacterized membrane protein